MTEKITYEHIDARIESVQRELTEFKKDSKGHRENVQVRLRIIEQKIAQLGGGWKVLVLLGAILTGVLAAIASLMTILKGVK